MYCSMPSRTGACGHTYTTGINVSAVMDGNYVVTGLELTRDLPKTK